MRSPSRWSSHQNCRPGKPLTEECRMTAADSAHDRDSSTQARRRLRYSVAHSSAPIHWAGRSDRTLSTNLREGLAPRAASLSQESDAIPGCAPTGVGLGWAGAAAPACRYPRARRRLVGPRAAFRRRASPGRRAGPRIRVLRPGSRRRCERRSPATAGASPTRVFSTTEAGELAAVVYGPSAGASGEAKLDVLVFVAGHFERRQTLTLASTGYMPPPGGSREADDCSRAAASSWRTWSRPVRPISW